MVSRPTTLGQTPTLDQTPTYHYARHPRFIPFGIVSIYHGEKLALVELLLIITNLI